VEPLFFKETRRGGTTFNISCNLVSLINKNKDKLNGKVIQMNQLDATMIY